MKEQEVWRDIPGYEDMYQASTLGRIRSIRVLKPYPTCGTGYPSVGLPADKVDGTLRAKRHHVHALVALTFIGPRPHGKHIDHKDGNRENPRLTNLEYVTPQENHRRSYLLAGSRRLPLKPKQMDKVADLYFEEGRSALSIAHEMKVDIKAIHSIVQIWRCRKGRKKNPYQHKLTRKKFAEMKKLYETTDLTITAVAKLFELSPSHASRVLKKDTWGHPKYIYKNEREEIHHDAELRGR
jgi:hypothetical protein